MLQGGGFLKEQRVIQGLSLILRRRMGKRRAPQVLPSHCEQECGGGGGGGTVSDGEAYRCGKDR